MDLDLAAEELAGRLDTIAGLRGYSFPRDDVAPPAAFMAYPENVQFVGTLLDRVRWPVIVVVGAVDELTTRRKLTAFTSRTGPTSIKRVLEAGTYTAFDTFDLTEWDYDMYPIAGVDYMAAIGTAEITGT